MTSPAAIRVIPSETPQRTEPPRADSAEYISSWLIERIASLLERPPQEVDVNMPLQRYGIDSVEAVVISGDLEELLGRRLDSTLVWDYPTIAQLAEHLGVAARTPPSDVLKGRAEARSEPAPETAPRKHGFEHFDDVKNHERRLSLLSIPTVGNPYFRLSEGTNGDRAIINGKEVLNFSNYNYLGLSGHPEVSQAAKDATDRYGTSASASRLIAGERPVHRDLEESLARFMGVEDSIVYVGGHSTNVSTIGHLFEHEDLIIYDALIHDSVLRGAELAGASRVPFHHQDFDELEEILARRRKDYRNVLIVVEGVYSADGDIPDLPRCIELKKRYSCFLMVDEAHSIGVLGKSGRGVGEHFGVNPADVDIWMGTLSKSLASCGGYIAGSKRLIQYLRYTSPGFVFSVGMPPPNAAAAVTAIRVLEREPERVTQLHQRVNFFLKLAHEHNLDTGTSKDTGVVPVIIGDTLQCIRLADILLYRGINVAPMVYPAVSNNGARLRFFISSTHTEEQIRYTVETVAKELGRLKRMFSGSFEVLESDEPVVEPPNAALARDGFEGFVKMDIRVLSRQLHEDVVYYFPGNSPIAGVHRGKDNVLDFFVNASRCTFGTLNVRLKTILSDENHGVLVWRNSGYLPELDLRLETEICEILTVTNGKVSEAHWYVADQKAFDDFLIAGTKLLEKYQQSGPTPRNPFA
jgi:8-amino-7-oxononanoate synthase